MNGVTLLSRSITSWKANNGLHILYVRAPAHQPSSPRNGRPESLRSEAQPRLVDMETGFPRVSYIDFPMDHSSTSSDQYNPLINTLPKLRAAPKLTAPASNHVGPSPAMAAVVLPFPVGRLIGLQLHEGLRVMKSMEGLPKLSAADVGEDVPQPESSRSTTDSWFMFDGNISRLIFWEALF